MLSDEERMAIDYLQLCYDLSTITNESLSKLGIVLNLIEKKQKEIEELNWKIQEQRDLLKYKSDKIEKQSKEIEELKKNNETQPDCVETVEKTEEMVNMRWVNHRFISKDKIKEILGIEETDDEKILSLLQTLVDENARLEDIEDKKVQIEYNNVFNKGVKSVEDKIKAKIEEINKREQDLQNSINDKEREEYSDANISWKLMDIHIRREVLQSLLDKEE